MIQVQGLSRRFVVPGGEVWAVRDGRLLDEQGHYERLERSLHEIRMENPTTRRALAHAIRETVRRNRVRDGLVYLQITRGVAPRDHAFPPHARASTVITARSIDAKAAALRAQNGVRVITSPDIRWARCDIKTTGLLANVLAKQSAREAGAYEAWFYDEAQNITEGASTNAWIVTSAGVLVTRDTQANILRGVTRAALVQIAKAMQMRVEQRAFSIDEAKQAREAFISSASGGAVPVVAIDGVTIGSGKRGPIVTRLQQAYLSRA